MSYVAEFRALADYCSFGDSVDTMICDRLINFVVLMKIVFKRIC